jgi:hypothetical protein
MNSLKPWGLSKLSGLKSFFSVKIYGRQRIIKRLILVVVALVIVIGGVWYIFFNSKPKLVNIPPVQENAADANVRLYKNSANVDELRILTNSYLSNGNYTNAVATAEKVADETQDTMDYMTILRICATSKFPSQSSCLDTVVANLKTKLDSLSFYDAYSAGSMLDENAKKGKDAVAFYQRAYDTYDATRADEYTKTKDQLKARIDELNK